MSRLYRALARCRYEVAARSVQRFLVFVWTVSYGKLYLAAPRLLPALGLFVSAAVLAFVACDYEEYPLAPTFCDDWCRVLQRPGCTQEPENCISDCEDSLAGEACFDLQRQLLDCYDQAPVSDFVCVGRPWRSEAEPLENVCSKERDRLVTCEYPEVKLCFDVCRQAERTFAEQLSSLELSERGLTETSCAPPDIPCENLCWTLERAQGLQASEMVSSENSDAGVVVGPDAGADLDEIGIGLIACALAKAYECYALEADGQSTDAYLGDWRALLFSCLPSDFGGDLDEGSGIAR